MECLEIAKVTWTIGTMGCCGYRKDGVVLVRNRYQREGGVVLTIWGREGRVGILGRSVTVYPFEWWVNLMPCRFQSQDLIRLDLAVS